MKVLVVGANGQIGHQVVEKLKDKAIVVVAGNPARVIRKKNQK